MFYNNSNYTNLGNMYSCIKTTTGPLACVILVSNILCTTPQLLGKMLKS